MFRKSRKKKDMLAKNIILNIFYHILLIITPLITAPYVSRVLGSDGIGIYSYSNSLVTYFTVFAALGTVSYGTREVARFRESKEEYSRSFWGIEFLTILTSLISLSAWFILAICYKEYEIYLLVFSFQIVATALDISWLYAGLEKYHFTIGINSLAKITGVFLILIFVKSRDDLAIYVLINVLVHVVGNLSMWIFLPKVVSKTSLSTIKLKTHLKETMVYFIPSIATILYTILDKTLIGILIKGYVSTELPDGTVVEKKISDIENGYYEQATSIITMIKTVCFVAINGVMVSRASYLFKKKDTLAIKKLTAKTYDITLFLSIGASVGVSSVSSIFVPLFFGDGFEKTSLLLCILGGIVPVVCLSAVLGSLYYTPSGNRKKSALFTVVGMLVNLVLSIPLILVYQSAGAAIASLVAEIIITVLCIIFCKGAITVKELFGLLWKKIVAASLMGGFILGIVYSLTGIISPILILLGSILLGVILYILVLLILADPSILVFKNILKEKCRKFKIKLSLFLYDLKQKIKHRK